MGQHASSEANSNSAFSDPTSPTPRQTDNVFSEDETMVDVSSASSMTSAPTRSSLQREQSQPTAIPPSQSPPSSSSNAAATRSRNSRRSNLWCRVQSLRNRIYRTSRNLNIDNHASSSSSPIVYAPPTSSAPPSSSPSARRSLFRNTVSAERRRSLLHPQPRPRSYHSPPDPFVHNIDPRYDPIDLDPRPRTSHASPSTSTNNRHHRRSIWSSSNTSTAASTNPNPALTTQTVQPSSTLPSVIDHSSQAASTHPIQPFNITRRPGEDQAEMLSRFLYVAGAALAASLVGSTEYTTAQLQDFSADFADAPTEELEDAPEGSFEGFLRALRQGRSQFAQALRGENDNSANTVEDETTAGGFNYLLMYRFNHREEPSALSSRSSAAASANDSGRTLARQRPPTPMPPSDDTASISSMVSSQDPERTSTSSSASSTTPAETRMIPFVIIGVQPVPPRDPTHHATTVPSFSEGVASLLANARNQNTLERRSTNSSTHESQSTDLTTVPSIPGAWRDSPPPMLDGSRRRASVDGSFRHSQPNNNAGSNVLREPSTRAWQMYIYGGAYPENHLIFTAPTLFTENPSSEDMLLLASILGEVKPPVASKEEIDAAGGITLVGEESKIDEGDRCLVCLSDYEKGEECRTLSGCGHIFHRECIDQWLASGRNACPLCRGVGVATKDSKESPTSPSSTSEEERTSAPDLAIAVGE